MDANNIPLTLDLSSIVAVTSSTTPINVASTAYLGGETNVVTRANSAHCINKAFSSDQNDRNNETKARIDYRR